MAEGKKSFLFYTNWGDTFDELTDEDAGKLIKHLCDYTRDKDPQTDNLLIKAVFANIKSILKMDLDKWEAKSLKNSESAKKRWDKNNANASERTERIAKHADIDIVIGNDIDIDILLEKETKAFDSFWNDYDKKAGDKSKCKSKFLNLSEKVRKEIMDYIPKYKLSQPDNKFRKNPEVFLNQKGWKHEILKEETASNNNSHVLTGSWKK